MPTNLLLPHGLLYAGTVGQICSAASSFSCSLLFDFADVPHMRKAAASRQRRQKFTCAPPPFPPSCGLSRRCKARGGYYRGDLIKAQHFDDFAAVSAAPTPPPCISAPPCCMSGPFFDRLNPFKGSTSLDPKGFRVSSRGTAGCRGTLLPCVQRKATLKSHIRGQFTSFPHCSVTLDGTLLELVCFR